MTPVLIGNVIGFIAATIMVYTGYIKQKDKILIAQTVETFLLIISNAVVGGITGAIINVINSIRNILCYKEKLTPIAIFIIIVLSVGLSVYFNTLGVIGLLPVVASVAYVLLMNMKDIIKFKCLIIFTMVLWLIYDISVKLYTTAVFDLLTIIASVISIIQILEGPKTELRDLYDINSNKTEKTYHKGDKIPEGYYPMVVMVIIKNSKNEFLMQKRVESKGGDWGVTGGHPKAGQIPIEGIITEVKEELGLDFSKEEFTLYDEGCDGKDCFKMYFVNKDIDINDIKIQEDELTEVRWFSMDELNHMVETKELNPDQISCFKKVCEYLDGLSKFENKLIRLKTNNNEIFEGICRHSSQEFNECEFGIDEQTIDIENFKIRKSEIEEIECIDDFTGKYSDLERLTVKEGIIFIEDVLESEEKVHKTRLLDYLYNETEEIDCKEEIKKILNKLINSSDKDIKEKSERLLKKWS